MPLYAKELLSEVVPFMASNLKNLWLIVIGVGHSLGQVVYSLPLAPCESVNIAVIDWSLQDTTVRTDDRRATETLFMNLAGFFLEP